MKTRIFLMFILVVVLGVAGVSAQGGRKVVTHGTEVFDPYGILGAPVGEFLDLGTVQCPGFQPTGDPLQPCPAGSRMNLRDTKWKSRFISGTPGVSDGWFTITANSNLDANFTGPQWGTFSLAYDSGGSLDGTWQGVRYKEGSQWVTVLHTSGNVTGGDLDGTKMEGTDEITSFTPVPIAYIGAIEARALTPK